MLFLLRIHGVWAAFRSEKYSRGIEAERVVWLEKPEGAKDEASVMACVFDDETKVVMTTHKIIRDLERTGVPASIIEACNAALERRGA